MASGTLVGGGGDGSREKHRWGENKVYTRKFHKSSGKSSNLTTPQILVQPSQPPASSQLNIDDVNSSIQQPAPSPKQNHDQRISSFESDASGDYVSTLNVNGRRDDPPCTSDRDATQQQSNHNINEGSGGRKLINLSSKTRHEIHELRVKLTQELEQVRALAKRLESRAASAVPAVEYTQSQLSASNAHPVAGTKRPAPNSEAASAVSLRRQLSVSVAPAQMENNSVGEVVEKEKRTPKANQYYRNSDFLLAKDKFPPAEPLKRSKSSLGKRPNFPKEDGILSPTLKKYAQAFKSCASVLSKLMKHKFGWVFNAPVDVKGLGLHDYYTIIERPMDLGTIKTRLEKGWYKSPGDFAEDVRLTFSNAMTYNPKGQDVHLMAEELSKVFEERWPSIEAECAFSPQPLDVRVLERSGSTTHPMAEISPRPAAYKTQVARPPAMKKPKAKEPNKRGMTYEEKQKLSNNLQSLPPEKLDSVVQIIKKRTASLSQHEDEIEVDIDSVDNETLWELDRFVTNYKKSLSKNKRRAELASLARGESLHRLPERNLPDSIPLAGEPPDTRPVTTQEKRVEDLAGEKNGDSGRSSSSSSSSSDSGTSSSDSDSDSSSASGTDVGHSP
ncbi:transcription factor GTE4-like [Wolffia australiana]